MLALFVTHLVGQTKARNGTTFVEDNAEESKIGQNHSMFSDCLRFLLKIYGLSPRQFKCTRRPVKSLERWAAIRLGSTKQWNSFDTDADVGKSGHVTAITLYILTQKWFDNSKRQQLVALMISAETMAN